MEEEREVRPGPLREKKWITQTSGPCDSLKAAGRTVHKVGKKGKEGMKPGS